MVQLLLLLLLLLQLLLLLRLQECWQRRAICCRVAGRQWEVSAMWRNNTTASRAAAVVCAVLLWSC